MRTRRPAGGRKVYLVQPRFPASYWGMEHFMELTPFGAVFPPLGLITLVCLVASTVFATLLVRRRDLISVVVAPPLVFVAVAAVNIGLAPSAQFSLPTIATLLVRGFPTMAIATGVAIVLALFRLVARR